MMISVKLIAASVSSNYMAWFPLKRRQANNREPQEHLQVQAAIEEAFAGNTKMF